jgi:hypothetical protein
VPLREVDPGLGQKRFEAHADSEVPIVTQIGSYVMPLATFIEILCDICTVYRLPGPMQRSSV